MSWMDNLKKASKGVMSSGAKSMLKMDIALLDREIKTRKQTFGIDIYDMMAELETNDTFSAEEKEQKIRAIFDAARKDIAVFQAKKDCKLEEMAVMDAEHGKPASNNIPPPTGTVITNEHPSEEVTES
ncbi:hypothetical protein FisN_15Lh286 [Fistulifera solaris]|uniref:Uncharacterized protein n=1 Tax=Fistulifera solaris TaxID=1519565 RepID=A0A1Z5K1Q9_FISSO|nr:hypothetical protein FisN_15Lh286 [Fistulifera solaris]|eukprot:GAX20234.1 hypothetical protein FisN_15Lh286 [Fistulifera solaris]